MGVDLSDIVVKHPKEMGDFAGERIAIDAFNTLYQFLSIIRGPDGTPLKDAEGRVTSHLSGLLYRNTNFLEAGIRPVYVFDGEPPPLKRRTIEERAARKRVAEQEYRDALARGDLETARTKAAQTARLEPHMVDETKEVLEALGIPWVQAPSEGEAQAAAMAARGEATQVGSQDFDSLLFGAGTLVRNLAVSGRRKLPGRNAFVTVVPEVVPLAENLEALGLTRDQLIDVAMLVGTDFNEGVRGYGPKKALKLIKQHHRLEEACAAKGLELPPSHEEIRAFFKDPPSTRVGDLRWGLPDRGRVLEIYVEQHQFSRQRVESALDKVGAVVKARDQRSLDAFF
ncbi:MAG TPA: flap endonuclease-1 [Candidatus Thermoplasmatota archaeon]